MDAPVEDAVTLPAAMTAAEQALLCAAAAGRRTGLEFGSGGSTGLLLAAGIGTLLTIDSDATWLERVARDGRCAAAAAAGRLRLWHADIGPTGDWGWPADLSGLPRWPAYWREPWEQAGPVDLALVDGRFRVAAALAGVMRLAPGGVLLVHDFWARPAYRPPLLRHFDLVGSAGTLALLAARAPPDAAKLAVDLVAHAFDPH